MKRYECLFLLSIVVSGERDTRSYFGSGGYLSQLLLEILSEHSMFYYSVTYPISLAYILQLEPLMGQWGVVHTPFSIIDAGTVCKL